MIEGVMMRNKERCAVAVRLKNGAIKIKKEPSSRYPKIFQVFFIRGIVGLAYALHDGIKALIWSSNQQLEEKEKLTKKELIGTTILSLIFAFIIFVAVPFFSAQFLAEGFWFNVLDGIFRVALFVGYLAVISLMKDVQVLFRYHGAEHKTIACYEAQEELTVKNVKKHSRFHPRCGTSFLFLVLLLSIILFSLITGPWYIKLGGRILLLPFIAGIGYELLKLGSKYSRYTLVKIFIAPGLWLQRITTKEPNGKQIEVGIRSLKAVLR